MKEFFLCVFFIFKELDIIDEEYIDIAVPLTETLRIFILDGLDEFIGKIFTGDAAQTHIGKIFSDFMADGMHQMGFSQPGIPVDKEWIVFLGRCAGYG